MSLGFVRVKEEWEVTGVSELVDLYVGHEVKEELVLGPEVLQPPDMSFVHRGRFKGKAMSELCAADGGVVLMKNSASGTLYHNKASLGRETVLVVQHKIKQDLLCNTAEPPMVQIHSPCFFDDFAIKPADIKQEPTSKSKSTSNQKKFEKLEEKYKTQHNIKPCSIPLVRIEELHKTNEDRNNNNKSVTDNKTTRTLKKFFCDYCGKGFSTKQSVLVHIRIHTGEKPFGCKVCNKKFSDMSILIRHRRIHTGEKPHICDVCQKQFSEKYLLRYHKRIHTGVTPYVCKFCSKTYNHISNWKRHLRTHDKPFTCEICYSRFNLQSKLETHLLTHLKSKPFSCDFCQKTFAIKGHLNRHLNTHLNVKNYSCKVCKAKFSQHASLKKHIGRRVCGKL